MPYTHANYLQFRRHLASRLGDAGNVFYSDAELSLYVIEGLRTWQAMTGYWRDRGSFNTSNATAFYDLSAVLQTGLYDYNVKDQDLASVMQYHLLEPANNWNISKTWAGTDMFVMSDLTNALQRRRDQFLKDAGVVLTNATIFPPPPSSGRVVLGDTVIDIRRLAWKDSSSNYVSPLFRSTEFSFDAFQPGWSMNPGQVPLEYSVAAAPPLAIQLAPSPLSSGSLDLAGVNAGTVLDVSVGVLMGIPDNFSWVVKWGALADLFSRDGQSSDPFRAAYCQQRYDDGVLLARSASSVLHAQIDGQDIQTESLYDLDVYNPPWQTGTGSPKIMAIAGLNLVALGPVPDATGYSVVVDVIRNAALPALDADYLQLGREELDAVLDYCEHIASLKMGGEEFQSTIPLYQRFVQAASIYNDRLKSSVVYIEAMGQLSQREGSRNQRRQSDSTLRASLGG